MTTVTIEMFNNAIADLTSSRTLSFPNYKIYAGTDIDTDTGEPILNKFAFSIEYINASGRDIIAALYDINTRAEMLQGLSDAMRRELQ